MANSRILYAVSDATGELAYSLAFAAARQFTEAAQILRRPRVSTPDRITRVVREAAENSGIIVFTLVSDELRQQMLRTAAEMKVPAIDVMGPLMANFTQYFHASPSDQPGMQYQLTTEYFRRTEAVEYTVHHDDSLGLGNLDNADIVLVGISRTSKTPLSIYLAHRGFKVANVPIVKGVPPPTEIRAVSPKKLIGLTISADKLVELRTSRLTKMGKSLSDSYANLENVREELSYAQRIFSELGNIPVIDVTAKAIEEVATEVLSVLGRDNYQTA